MMQRRPRWRLPAVWLATAGLACLLLPMAAGSFHYESFGADSYYVRMHAGLVIPAAVAIIGLSAVYLLLDVLLKADYPRWLAWAQWAATCAGLLLLSGTARMVGIQVMPRRYVDDIQRFHQFVLVDRAGYLCFAASLALFVAVLLSAVLRRFDRARPPGRNAAHPGPGI